MSAHGPYLRKTECGWAHRCPACDEAHHYYVEQPHSNGSRWSFNGNAEKPSFSPSMLITSGSAVDPSFKDEPGDPPTVCHYFLTDGQIQFCGDSTHALAGQTVPLPKWWREDEETDA